MPFKINYATEEEMIQCLPRIGIKRARRLVYLRETEGAITSDTLSRVLKADPSQDLLNLIDFEVRPATLQVPGAGFIDRWNPLGPTSVPMLQPDVGTEILTPEKINQNIMRPDSSMFSDLVRGARQGMETGSPGAKCKPNEDKGYSWERTGWTFDSKLRPSHTETSKTTRLFNKDCLLKDSSLSSGESSVADLERRLSNLRMSTDNNLIFNQTKQEPPSRSDRSLKQEPFSASLFKSAEEIKKQLIEQHAQQLALISRLEHAASGSLSRTTKRSYRSLKQEDVNKEKGHTDLSARPSRSINKGKSDVKPTLSISRMSMESGMQGQTDRCCTSASVDTRSPSHTRSLKGHRGDRYSRHRRQSPRTTTSHGKSDIQDSRTRKGSRDSRSSRSEFKVTRAKGSRSDKHQRSRSSSSSSSSPEGRYLSDKRQHKKNKSSKSRYHKSKREGKKSKLYFSSSNDSSNSSSEEGSLERFSKSRRGNPTKLPKNLKYDGKTNWLSFKQKFESFRSVLRWSDTESRDYLIWSLDGKALDFITTSMGTAGSYRSIMKRLEGRFGAKELKETSKAKFQQAQQKQDESLEDWADRVMTLATPAFRDLPDKYAHREAISKFCQGCVDKEAGKHACFANPGTMEAALDKVKQHQYITQAVDGKSKKKAKDEVTINAVESLSQAKVETMIEKALSRFTDKFTKAKEDKKEKTTKSSSNSACFFCKKTGHFKKDCEKYKKWLQKKKDGDTDNSTPDLNTKGSGV
ncbi:uncharacterized protein LOC117316785 [Pecten maximus]|uniref:uncharacterized protein LOC117316785 n=1 Tax=Pecten maximus TaxID=6579 RepID=UPI001458052B|nr:uncharacterized protein LOC117316785 [Pecten maximus]